VCARKSECVFERAVVCECVIVSLCVCVCEREKKETE